MTLTRRLSVLAAVTALSASAACGSSQPKAKVATLQTPGAGGTMSARASGASHPEARPRERLDMTPEEQDALWATYNRCLDQNGLSKFKPKGGAGSGPKAVRVDPKVEAKAEAACKNKEPLPPWQYDTANPESLDFLHKMVRCLREKGVRYVEETPAGPGEDRNAISFGGKNNDRASISKGLNLTPVCEKELSVGGGHK